MLPGKLPPRRARLLLEADDARVTIQPPRFQCDRFGAAGWICSESEGELLVYSATLQSNNLRVAETLLGNTSTVAAVAAAAAYKRQRGRLIPSPGPANPLQFGASFHTALATMQEFLWTTEKQTNAV